MRKAEIFGVINAKVFDYFGHIHAARSRAACSPIISLPGTLVLLSISTEKICFVVRKAREFDVKDAPTIPDDASNASDDRMVGVLDEDRPDDPVVWELAAFIGAMNEDEQIDLVTLTWPGLGDGGLQNGTSCAPRLCAGTTGMPPSTCSGRRFCPTIWKTASPAFAHAPNSSAIICDSCAQHLGLTRFSERHVVLG